MTTPQALEERITPLEYAVFEQFPATVAAMTHGTTQIYAETMANGEAIAGLRVDMLALQASFHREVSAVRGDVSDVRGDVAGLKAAIDLQGDSLRKELGVATAGFRADVTGLRETISMRFQKVDGQFNAVYAEMNHRFAAADQRFDGVDQRFDGVDQRLNTLDAKLDMILGELRKPTD